MARIVVLGSSNTDFSVALPHLPAPGQTVLGGRFLTSPGGKGANQAVAARRAGADVVFVTAVGDDPLGFQSLEHYRAEGIDVSRAVVVPGTASGVALIFVGGDGENMIGVAPGANARLDSSAVDALPSTVFAADGVLLASLELPLETVARAVQRARGAGMRVVLNPAPADPRLVELGGLGDVDVLTPNLVELGHLVGRPLSDSAEDVVRAANDLRGRGVGAVVVTMGSRGCLVVDGVASAGTGHEVAAFRVEAVDTVGAGDAFSGALAAALAGGRPLRLAARWASAAAALAVTRQGAQSALPHREAIDRLAGSFPD